MTLKKFICAFLAVCICSGAVASFSKDEYATRGEVCAMLLEAADYYNSGVKKEDILKGYEDGKLYEEKYVTRAEALVMLKRAFSELPQCVGHNARVAIKSENFTDIPLWAQNELKEVFDKGIAGGIKSGIFAPNNLVTKEQMRLFIKRVYALFAENPNDDFYAAVNRLALEESKTEDGEAQNGTVFRMQKKVYEEIYNKVKNIEKNEKNSAKRKIKDFYDSAADTRTKNKNGINPIKEYLARIDSINNISELAKLQNTLSAEFCTDCFLSFSIARDTKNTDKHLLSFKVKAPLMYKEAYFDDTNNAAAYKEYIEKILILSGEESETAHKNTEEFFEFEKTLAESMLDLSERSDNEKVYSKVSYNKLSAAFPDFDFDGLLQGAALEKREKILVEDISLVKRFSELFNQENFLPLKTAAKVLLIEEWGIALCEDFSKERERFESRIYGKSCAYDADKKAFFALLEAMPECVSEMYCENAEYENTEKEIRKIADDIIAAFKEQSQNIDWKDSEKKQSAAERLDSLKIKIGVPENFNNYIENVHILSPKEGGTHFSNLLEIKKEKRKSAAYLQNTDVNRDAWDIYPYSVNASYNPLNNDITLPQALLNEPLCSKENTYEENLAGIGFIIAHEVAHALKLEEGLCDALCNKALTLFDGAEAIPAVGTDGKLTLSENIADIAALSCITQLAKQSGCDLASLYVIAARTLESTKTREYAYFLSKTDVHSDEKLRINKALMCIDEFYDTFNVKEGDGMYLDPDCRVKIQ